MLTKNKVFWKSHETVNNIQIIDDTNYVLDMYKESYAWKPERRYIISTVMYAAETLVINAADTRKPLMWCLIMNAVDGAIFITLLGDIKTIHNVWTIFLNVLIFFNIIHW